MKKYQPQEFEKKWIESWEKDKVYRTSNPAEKKGKKYILDMFPYPSAAGLHVGHPRGYVASDIIARYYRMAGYAVLHPMGWDSFGLPAENAAIKARKNPIDMVPSNIATFKRQMMMLGLSYDWDREFTTTDPSYYKWTQWLFLKFYQMGLLYKKDTPINFCPFCKTGLAEEEVLPNGTHERCGTKIIKKELPQWIFKITAYADRLLADLKGLNWPQGILDMQKNWIGRKEGVIISHKVEGMDLKLETFSAYPAWLWADTFMVIAPEHPLVKTLVKGLPQENEVFEFVQEYESHTKEELEKGLLSKKGVFTGRYAFNPFNKGKKMPIWLANFALMDFGTGIIRCSAHDARDFEFAQKYNIKLKEVVDRVDTKTPVNAHENHGILKDSGSFSGREINSALIKGVVDWIEKEKIGRREVTYHLHDWIFSRQRYWGEPIPMVFCQKDGWQGVSEDQLPVKLPYVKSYEPTGTGESPLANIKEWVNTTCPVCSGPAKRETDTMPNWAGSNWYFLRFADPHNDKEAWNHKAIKEWLPVDWYLGGAEHAVLHLLYARFWVKALSDEKLLDFEEPFLRLNNQGMILAEDHRKMSKSLGNVVNPDEVVGEYGADTLRLYEMFLAPFNQEISWSTKTFQGAYRFINRVWKLFHDPNRVSGESDSDLNSALQKTISKVGRDITGVKFNTAISSMMEFINEWQTGLLSKNDAKKFLQILAPFAPFTTEEIWHEVFGEKNSIHLSTWPKIKSVETVEEDLTIPVQVNGKVRAVIMVKRLKMKDQRYVTDQALKEEKIKKYIEGKKYKVIYVPGKILNLVI